MLVKGADFQVAGRRGAAGCAHFARRCSSAEVSGWDSVIGAAEMAKGAKSYSECL
ncbi:MAG: hypothetical protein OIN90_03420 [Candidatus Methanoperedens sp.]|nr:hypothetical protein [Candidatus Methanoperedens sp.]